MGILQQFADRGMRKTGDDIMTSYLALGSQRSYDKITVATSLADIMREAGKLSPVPRPYPGKRLESLTAYWDGQTPM